MATTIESLFGINPEALQAQRDAALQAQALQFAQLSPMQQSQMGFYMAGNRLGGGIGGLLGAQDPELERATKMQAAAKSANLSTPEGLLKYAQEIQQYNPQAALIAAAKAQELRKMMAEAGKVELSTQQEEKLRSELAALGPNATQDQVLAVVTKYGSADKVLTALQASADKQAKREQDAAAAKVAAEARVEAAKAAAEARVEVARMQGATAREIAQMRADAAKEIAQLRADMKGPSAAELKRQDAMEKAAEGRAGLEGTLDKADALVEDLAKAGGMTSTASGGLTNLTTSLGTSAAGQAVSRAFGTAVQSKRDELSSVRLQLLNDIKAATGMSSQQLNSNVELQTWLNSLGGPGLTKEANKAIINNIRTRFLGGSKQPTGKGTANDPIVLR